MIDAAAPLTLEDRLKIMERYARYAWTMDSGDVDGYVSNFVPDATLDLGVRHEGHAGIRAWHEHFLKDSAFPGSQHFTSQIFMDGSTDRCNTRAYVARLHRLPRTTSSQVVWQGYYTDTLVKVSGEWLFTVKKSHWAEELRDRQFGQEPSPGNRQLPPDLYDMGAPMGGVWAPTRYEEPA